MTLARCVPFNGRRAPALALAAVLAVTAGLAAAQTQSWNYKSYPRDRNTGQPRKDLFLSSTVHLTEKDGRTVFRMIAPGRGDPCISASDLPAEVERSAETLTITVTPALTGCEAFRYVIQNNGSGGIRLIRRSERWTPDGLDHDLTPVK
jgi:hypothetical protein